MCCVREIPREPFYLFFAVDESGEALSAAGALWRGSHYLPGAILTTNGAILDRYCVGSFQLPYNLLATLLPILRKYKTYDAASH
jgi:hypothetical protein